MNQNDAPTYTRIKARCLNCSLHFILCTDHPERHFVTTLYCPGCGQHQGHFMTWNETAKGFIFEEVPGNASPLGQ